MGGSALDLQGWFDRVAEERASASRACAHALAVGATVEQALRWARQHSAARRLSEAEGRKPPPVHLSPVG